MPDLKLLLRSTHALTYVCYIILRDLTFVAECVQDDSALNRKIIRRILESDQSNFSNAVIEEADDGVTAVSAVQSAMDAGHTFDCIFMDFVMVSV